MDDSGSAGVVVIGITNRPDLIDTSLLRPERLDLIVYIGPPDEKARLDIIKILTNSMPLANDINFKDMFASAKGFSGADLIALMQRGSS